MSWLAVFPEQQPQQRLRSTADPSIIEQELAPFGVHFERWSLQSLSNEEANEEVNEDPLVAYAHEVERLRQRGYSSIDVVQVAPDVSDAAWPDKARTMREKFRDEHTHAEDEVRFFAGGAGAFYLRLRSNVYCIGCEAGDLLSVPAGTRHWFDMGAEPRFTAIRFFKSSDGWVGNFSGESIARRFPSFDELAAVASTQGLRAPAPAATGPS